MGTVITIAMEIAIFIGDIMTSYMVNVKPVPVKVRVDSDRRAR